MKRKSIVFFILTYFILLCVCFKPMTGVIFAVKSKAYTANKYNISVFDIKIKNFYPSELYFQDGGLPIPVLETGNALAELEYQGKRFCVSGKVTTPYADDYQLDKVSEMAAEYLKREVNENICGVCVFSRDAQNVTLMTGDPINENSIKSFLTFTGYPKRIYIRVDNPENAAKTLNGEEIYNSLCLICHTDTNYLTVYLIDDTVKLDLYRRDTTKMHSHDLDSYYGVELNSAQSDEVSRGENKHIQILHINN